MESPEEEPIKLPAEEPQSDCSEQSEQSEQSGQTSPPVPDIDIDRLVAEAEQRGYLRGRNEAISEAMTTRPLWENSRLSEARALEQPDPASLFLSRIRPDVWD